MREPFPKASTYLTVLFVVQCLIAVAVILVAVTFEYILSAYMDSTGGEMLGAFLSGNYIIASQLIILYVGSVAIWRRLWTRAYSPNLKLFIRSWLAVGFVVHLCGLATMWSLYASAEAIVRTEENSLWRGINMYYTSPEWKLLWDGMQYHKQCCGVNNYTDWMSASWMPNTTTIECSEPGQGVVYKKNTLAPYACCRQECADCYQSSVPRGEGDGGGSPVPSLYLSQINQLGCMHMFSTNLLAMTYTLIGLMAVTIKFYFIIWMIVRKIMDRQPEPTREDIAYNTKKYTDDDGRSIILVKCPPNFKCIVEENELASLTNFPSQEEMDEIYSVRQEVLHVPPRMRVTDSQATCGCNLTARPSQILH